MQIIMKEKSYEMLEFYKVLDMLCERAISENVKHKIHMLEPYMKEAEVIRHMEETTQAKKIIEGMGNPPLATTTDIEKIMTLVEKDAMLLPENLNQVKLFLTACRRMKSYLKKSESTFTAVSYFGETIYSLTELEDEIDGCIRGDRVDDRASNLLSSIRNKIERYEDAIRMKLDALLRNNGDCFSESFVTMRNGHYTLPVKKEYKHKIQGSVIEISKSGGTYFIEPSAVKKVQDELSILHIEEDNEVRRILFQLTASVAYAMPSIKMNIQAMETLDFLFAKAKLSIDMKGVSVELTTDRNMCIQSGRHPLLKSEDTVPLDFTLGEKNRLGDEQIIEECVKGIIITGPNTGGKTVALKTVGLLSLMAQCGLHVPAKAARICMNNMVLCDIGDGQSITENLSTFSSHMKNIIEILRLADEQSLVLLDELGSGTDPAEGMGLAVTILEELAKKECLIIATTHYPEIKDFAKKTKGFLNARMAFDRQNMKPLYRLEIGEAGESCALYIARRLGLPEEMIEHAYAVAYGNHGRLTSRCKQQEAVELVNKVDINKVGEGELDAKDKAVNLGKDIERLGGFAGKESNLGTPRIQKKVEKQPKQPPKSTEFRIGDSVMVFPQKLIGIVFEVVNDKGDIGVQIQGKKCYVNYKRLKLHVSASELYPDDYDFSIVFDSVKVRKGRKAMSKRHDPNLVVDIEE